MHNVSRLIEKFKPKSYDLKIDIERVERKFSGTVTINGEIREGADFVSLHSKDLNIQSVMIDEMPSDFSFGDDDALNISYAGLEPGWHTVTINFSGTITDAMHGMYPCYFEHDGVKKELIATQFESHHAREVFPCVDEPEAKAIFDVVLMSESEVTVLGNMPIKSQTITNNKLITTFETTPIMSSYLLAWVIGELYCKTATTKGGVVVNVWATPAQPACSLDFPLDIAVRSIDFYDEYFGVPYPLAKSDHVALPDFAAGAMENWGLITYREVALLADPASTSIAGQRYIATVIAHELSHQWFGNLVTMKWWNDLWLNESFATLIEYVAIDNLQPDWNVWLDFASFETVISMKRDSLDGVQPVQVDVHHPDEIGTIFDGAIVYAKGAHLMQMLHNYIGEKAFRAGLKDYFTSHAYGNTEANDLWQALEHASGKDVAAFMTTWISKPGFPVLSVERHNDILKLRQDKLQSTSCIKSDDLWPIPLNDNCPETFQIMTERDLEIDCDRNKLVRFNIGGKGHYVTRYDQETLEKFINQIKRDELLPLDRLQIINDNVIMASVGAISNADLVTLVNAYCDEKSESVWNLISMTIGELKKFIGNDEVAKSKLKSLIINLTANEYERLGWDKLPNESAEDTKLRSIIIGLLLYAEKEEIITKALNTYETQTLEAIDPELRDLIITAVVRHHGDRQTIESLVEAYKQTVSNDLKQDLTGGLTSVKSKENVAYILHMLTDTDVIRPQDTFRWVAYMLRNKYARTATWQWMRDNWHWINKTFGGDKSYSDFPRFAGDTLATREHLNEYITFFEPLKSDPSLTRTIDIAIKQITDRVNLIERDGPEVRAALVNLD